MNSRLSTTMSPPFRILSLDGGGIRGVFPAAFLAKLEEHLNAPIGSYFDLIAGTSTGGIIAIGLGLGLSAKDILKLYEEQGPAIFDQHHGRCANFIRTAVARGVALGRLEIFLAATFGRPDRNPRTTPARRKPDATGHPRMASDARARLYL